MKKYQSPDMKLIVYRSEEVLGASDSLELPAVPLTLRGNSSADNSVREDGSYNIF
jgi:hypothetical protein